MALSSVNTIYLYTDGSYSRSHQIGVAGFLLYKSSEDNELGTVFKSSLQKFNENSNIRVEFKAAIMALEFIISEKLNFSEIQLFTDCKAITDLLQRRKRLESRNYISQNKNKPLTHTDLYKKLFTLTDHLSPQMNWIKGHSSDKSKNPYRSNFNLLDRTVRKELRAQCQ